MEGQRVECFENFIYEKQTFENLGTKKQTSVKVLGWKWYFILNNFNKIFSSVWCDI